MWVFGGQEYCAQHTPEKEILGVAKRRLTALSIPAVRVMENGLEEEDPPCPVCGRGYITPQKLKIAKMVLDRNGFGPTMKVEVTGSITHEILIERMTDAEFKVVNEIMSKVMARVQAEVDEEQRLIGNGSANSE